jgi:SNF2 family DNA or RNA helicase
MVTPTPTATATATSCGTLRHIGLVWEIDCSPHVAIRVKRLFPRAQQKRTATIWIKDTPEVARDLEWLLERHPMEIDPDSHARLTARARLHREREEVAVRILSGGHALELRDPARPPRSYQAQAADLALSTGHLLLADDLGLGKTFSSLLVLRHPGTLPALVVTPTHLPDQWLAELQASLPWLSGHIATRATPYDVDADVLIMNYHKLAGWADHLAGQVRTVIFDEAQALRRHGTAKYNAAAMIADKADWRLGLTATPVHNYGGEIHSIMSILAPDCLGSRAEFLREWDGIDLGNGRARLKNPKALGSWLRDEGLMLRRTRKDVHRELPDPLRIVHHVDTDPHALDDVAGDVAAIAKLVLNTEANRTERWRAAGELDWRLRQATGIAKAAYVAEFVRLLLESEQQIVLFGWHRAVYDIWLDRLAAFNPVLYTGSESPKQKKAAYEAFMSGQSRILIMSLRSGEGLDGLQKQTSVAVFGELDWSPAMHDQCVGRLARDGQDATVAAYFLVADEGSDPVIADVLELKRQQAEPIRNPDAPLLETTTSSHDRVRLLAQAVVDNGGSPNGGR